MKRYLSTLEGEDLARYRQMWVRRLGIDLNPTAYSQAETETSIQGYWRFFEEVRNRHELANDELALICIEPVSGQVYLDDDA